MYNLVYCGLPSQIYNFFQFLWTLLKPLGLDVNLENLVSPSTTFNCLGIMINTETRTISVVSDMLSEIIATCQDGKNKKVCSKRQLQSLWGSLLCISKCVIPARNLNGMLQLLRDNHVGTSFTLVSELERLDYNERLELVCTVPETI